MNKIVFDTSAIVALIRGEKGKEEVEKYLEYSVMSSVNVSETSVCFVRRDNKIDIIEDLLGGLIGEIVVFDEVQAYLAAELWRKTHNKGLSFGDRACLALAISRNLPVLTADKVWKDLKLGVKIHLIC